MGSKIMEHHEVFLENILVQGNIPTDLIINDLNIGTSHHSCTQNTFDVNESFH